MNKIGLYNDNLKKAKDYGINCLRLDSPLRANEIASLTHNSAEIDIELNMSFNDNLITNIMDFKPITPRLRDCHNFYPLEYTAIPFNFFEECNQKFKAYNLETSAFVGSHVGKMTTAVGWRELPTLEEQRNLSVSMQAKILFHSNQIDNVLIDNAYASENELKELASVDRYEINFDLITEKHLTKTEKEILLAPIHFRRTDITEYFIRSTWSRVVFKDSIIKPFAFKKTFNYGDVVIINDNDPKYKGEVHIILKDNFPDPKKHYNFVGSIQKGEFRLLEFVKSSVKFKFNLV